jgi:conjugal transfer pilus assembly protein TraF
MKASLPAALPRDRRGPGFIGVCIVVSALGLSLLANNAAAVPPTTKTAVDRDDARIDDSYWRDRERGWFWYDDPLPERNEGPKPKPKAVPTISAPTTPKKPSELVEFEALQKRVEDLRNIAIINPSEQNIRNYLNIQNFVIEKASTFADVAQRVIWATPELDPTVTGRPVNAKALEVFDREQAGARTNTVAQLSQTHALFFFFRSDCPYCHQFAPLLKDFEAKFGLKIVPISVDGGGLPEFRSPRVDNGIARTLDVRQVPALFLAEPRGGKITPIGYGVLSESELLERIYVVTQPDADKLVPSTTQYVPNISLR